MVIVVNMHTCQPPFGLEGDVRIDRATKWGNPFPLHNDTPLNRALVISKYETWLDAQLSTNKLSLGELKHAKRLGCWCKPKPCHGDVIKKKLDAIAGMEQTRLFGGDTQ